MIEKCGHCGGSGIEPSNQWLEEAAASVARRIRQMGADYPDVSWDKVRRVIARRMCRGGGGWPVTDGAIALEYERQDMALKRKMGVS